MRLASRTGNEAVACLTTGSLKFGIKKALTALSLLALVGCSDSTGGGERIIERYPSGMKKSEGYLLDGTMVGYWTFWHDNGQKSSEGMLDKNGELDGKHTVWWENGQKMSEGAYKNGKMVGAWTYWDQRGNIDLTEIWKNGIRVESDIRGVR